MNWLKPRLAGSMLESQCHTWKHKNKWVSMILSQMDENDAANVSMFNALNQIKWQ